MAGMCPVINTNYKGLDVIVECNQHDQGNVKHFTTENDLTGVSVRYVIHNHLTGSNVTDWCSVEGSHTVSMVIPVQITREPGTYEAQLIFYTKEYITNSFESWKAAVLNGDTVVNIDNVDTFPAAEKTEAPSNAVSSFTFYIKVYPSVFQGSDQYEADLINTINRMQATLLQHDSALESLRQQDTALSQNISKAQKAADDAAESAGTANTSLANLEGTVTSQGTSITTLQTTSDRHTEQITALQGSDVAGLSQAVSGLETWKQQVLDGQTVVDTLTTENPPEDANSGTESSTPGTEQPSAGTETAIVQEGEQE